MSSIPHYIPSSHQYALPAPNYLLPPFPNTSTQAFSSPPSPGESSIHVALPTLGTPLCPQCKGKKYGFTAYFHNKRIFPAPPHSLLHLIEASYVPKNRLKSLLLNYTTRSIDPVLLPEISVEIESLGQQVEVVLEQVRRAGFIGMDAQQRVINVQGRNAWAMKQLGGHVWGVSWIGKAEAADVMRDVKVAWEELWRACMREEDGRQHMGM